MTEKSESIILEPHARSAPRLLKRPNAKRLFFLIHGYTGSPTDFNGLPQYLYERNDTDVRVILLPGHGTEISALDHLTFKDFLAEVTKEFEQYKDQYEEVIVGGVSFGSLLSLILASKYKVRGVFLVCLPYALRFPFNIPFLSLLGYFKKYWSKAFSEEEKALRKNAFYYDAMHANGLGVVKDARAFLKGQLENITCPVLSVHTVHDPIGDHRASNMIKNAISAPYMQIDFTEKNHNIFFSPKRYELYEKVSEFFK